MVTILSTAQATVYPLPHTLCPTPSALAWCLVILCTHDAGLAPFLGGLAPPSLLRLAGVAQVALEGICPSSAQGTHGLHGPIVCTRESMMHVAVMMDKPQRVPSPPRATEASSCTGLRHPPLRAEP